MLTQSIFAKLLSQVFVVIDNLLDIANCLLELLAWDGLAILDLAYGFHDLLRIVLQVFDTSVQLSLISLEFLELPVADAKQYAIEKDYLTEPIDTCVESLIISQLNYFRAVFVIFVGASVLQELLNFVCAVAKSCEELVAHRMKVPILEMADQYVVDGAQGRPHDDDSKSDNRNGHDSWMQGGIWTEYL